MNSNIKNLCRCALFSAVLCICSVITIPTAPVPINLAFFGLLLTAFFLPTRDALISTAVYIALGLIGIPVFAGVQGGIGVLAGPTGGFIIGYLPMVISISMIKGDGNSRLRSFIAIFTGYGICYICGTSWYSISTGTDIISAAVVTTLPFIPADIIKAAGAFILLRKLKGLR